MLSLKMIFYDGMIFDYCLKGHCTKGQVYGTLQKGTDTCPTLGFG